MIELSFPDGSKKQYNAGVTGLEIATGISPQLAKAALAIKVDDDVEDLSRPIEKDAKIIGKLFDSSERIIVPKASILSGTLPPISWQKQCKNFSPVHSSALVRL